MQLSLNHFFLTLTAFLVLAGSGSVDAQAEAQQVNNLRLWHSPDRTRIVFDVSANVKHSMFTLREPLRLVIDLENVDLKMSLPQLKEANGHIAAIRSGRPSDGTLRFVFELEKTLEPKSFLLSPNELYGHRLVVDLNDSAARISHALSADSNGAESQGSAAVPILGVSKQGHSSVLPEIAINSGDVPRPIPQISKSGVKPVNTVPLLDKKLIVAIDAGHGGEDPGAIGYKGSREKKITLAIAKKLKQRIDRNPRMQAVLIRKGDYFIELHNRRRAAHVLGADIFVSIHADAFHKKSARGLSVFALSQRGATSAMARALAAKENAADLIGGVSLADKDQVLRQVLVDLSMTNTISESVNLGGRVLKELGQLGRLHSSRVEQAGFAVLKSPDIPSILVETGFITNPDEERKLRSSSYQQKIASAIYTAINEYYQQTPYFTNASYASPSVPSESATNNSVNAARAKPRYHKVGRGDSLSKISAKYNVTIRALKSANKLKRDTVFVGQKIKLPAGARTVAARQRFHKVKRGDTLSEIAEKYSLSTKQIMRANKMRSRTVLLGQTLKIPN